MTHNVLATFTGILVSVAVWSTGSRIGTQSVLNSIEPYIMNVAAIDLFYANEQWAKLRRTGAVEFVQRRLSSLSKTLGDKP